MSILRQLISRVRGSRTPLRRPLHRPLVLEPLEQRALLDATLDTTPPAVSMVTSSAAHGLYQTGDLLPITVTFSESVLVTGTPTLTLETGTTDAVVNYTSGSGTNTLTFNYTVAAGQTSVDLDYVSTAALALAGGTIRDADGNDAVLTLPEPGSINSLGGSKAIVILADDPEDPQDPVDPETATLGGRVYIDRDGDGTFSDGDVAVPFCTVALQEPVDPDDLTEGWVNVAGGSYQQTDEVGHYQFADLPAGTYRVVQSQPSNLRNGSSNTVDVELGEAEGYDEADFTEAGTSGSALSIRMFLASSPPYAEMIAQLNRSPVVDTNGPAAGRDNTVDFDSTGPVRVASSSATIEDSDSATLVGLVVRIADPLDGEAEVLDLDVDLTSKGISSSYEDGMLTLGGIALVSDYQTALRSITYDNTADSPNFSRSRTIHVMVSDGGQLSQLATMIVQGSSESSADSEDPTDTEAVDEVLGDESDWL